jgi:hypothetical protein
MCFAGTLYAFRRAEFSVSAVALMSVITLSRGHSHSHWQLMQLPLCVQTVGSLPYICPYMTFLCILLSAIIYARCLLSKDTSMSASLEEKCELMLVTFLSPVSKFNVRMEVKAILYSVAHVPLQIS